MGFLKAIEAAILAAGEHPALDGELDDRFQPLVAPRRG
jgi:hypothetical protein